ncbi:MULTISPECIES: hypothetical protein [Clostridioides]|nr:hypothetical protein [Clostridioides sp. ZZV14-6387]CZR95536.1 hypothetical protein CDFC105_60324 [Clostridioides difficile]CZR99896.1 hypothetical protein CDFC105_70081 [Clostridioides difficile]
MYSRVCECCKKRFETNIYLKRYCSSVCKNKVKKDRKIRKGEGEKWIKK